MSVTITHTFNHPFSSVATVFWNKFPNDHSPHIKSIDYIDRSLVNGTLFTSRLFGVDIEHPILRTIGIVPATHLYSLEQTRINPSNKTLSGINKNISLRSIVECTDTFEYSQNENYTTSYVHKIDIKVSIPIIGSYIQKSLLSAAKEKSEQSIVYMDKLLH